MRRALRILLGSFLVLALAACGSDGGDGGGDTGGSGNGDTGGSSGGQHKACTPNFDGQTATFHGRKKGADCDARAGICENAVTPQAGEWYPCVEDPDCCCDSSAPVSGLPDNYGCEFDACLADGYCDPGCGAAPDPDC